MSKQVTEPSGLTRNEQVVGSIPTGGSILDLRKLAARIVAHTPVGDNRVPGCNSAASFCGSPSARPRRFDASSASGFPATELVGQVVNIGTKDGIVFDATIVAGFNERTRMFMFDGGRVGSACSGNAPRPMHYSLLSANRSTLAKMRHRDGVDRHELRRRKAAIGSSRCQRL